MELQTIGEPIAFSDKHDIQSNSFIGVDYHLGTDGSLASEMRLLLRSARRLHDTRIVDDGKTPQRVDKTMMEDSWGTSHPKGS